MRARHIVADVAKDAPADQVKAAQAKIDQAQAQLKAGKPFEEVAKAYAAARKRAAPKSSYRTYQVTAGIPGSTYLVFSSFENFADFDVLTADVEKTFAGATQDEQTIFEKWDETLIVSDGFSCREQILHATGRQAIHLAEAIRLAMVR